MKQLFIAMLLGITSLAHAQKIKVLNSITNEPIVGASLKKGDKTISISNERGEFQVNEKGEFTVTALGFKVTKTTGETSPIFLEESTQTLESVVVTASRQAATRAQTPVAIHKIGSALIQDTKALQLTEIINKVPGVVMLDYRNEQHGMGIRQPFGTSAYFLYMEDGLPLRPLGVFNHNALIESNLQGLNSVEVIKGPASSLYGPEAVGGAINLITKTAPGIPTAQVGLQVDEWGYNRVQFTAGAQVGKKWSIMTGG
ncbi:MAG: TonB-dependent receptor plug domain-containing protein, partial [Aquirufa sp.]